MLQSIGRRSVLGYIFQHCSLDSLVIPISAKVFLRNRMNSMIFVNEAIAQSCALNTEGLQLRFKDVGVLLVS